MRDEKNGVLSSVGQNMSSKFGGNILKIHEMGAVQCVPIQGKNERKEGQKRGMPMEY